MSNSRRFLKHNRTAEMDFIIKYHFLLGKIKHFKWNKIILMNRSICLIVDTPVPVDKYLFFVSKLKHYEFSGFADHEYAGYNFCSRAF